MNSVLREILETGKVRKGSEEVPLKHSMAREECELIDRAFRAVKPACSVEVGLAHGLSTLYACDALKANGVPCRHIMIDPYQTSEWDGIGLANIQRAGFAGMTELHEKGSEIVLPQLLAEGLKIQAAIIDGYHTFDHALVDFFYINKMLEVGGVVFMDDTEFPSIAQVVDHILTYPSYEIFGAVPAKREIKLRGRVRQELAKRTGAKFLRRSFDRGSAMAFRKIAPDNRAFDWHVPF
jgi:predicted O-methyltransferase YrrM